MNLRARVGAACAMVVAVVTTSTGAQQPCIGWGSEFVGREINGAAYYSMRDGADLYLSGSFLEVVGQAAGGAAKWSGGTWTPLPTGLSFEYFRGIGPMVFHDDDGNGPNPRKLFAAGSFPGLGGPNTLGPVAYWDGSAWRPVTVAPTLTGRAEGVIVFDEDGPGPNPARLFAYGQFGLSAPDGSLIRWDGTSWTRVGGTEARLTRLTAAVVFNDGTGDALYVAAEELGMRINEVSCRVAKWNGSTWQRLGNDELLNDSGGPVLIRRLLVHDADGQGPESAKLHIAGQFRAGPNQVRGLARWNGSVWEAVGPPLGSPQFDVVRVEALASIDTDGPGPLPHSLFVGGLFESAGPLAVKNVARLDGSTWSDLAGGTNDSVTGFHPSPEVEGQLWVTGFFTTAGQVSARGLAVWDGLNWSSRERGVGSASFDSVLTLGAFDFDGSGPAPQALLAGGQFTGAGPLQTRNLVQYRGGAWSAVPALSDGPLLRSLATVTLGMTAELLAISSDTAIVRDPAGWRRFAYASTNADNSVPRSIAGVDHGGGPFVYIGGAFTAIGGTPIRSAATLSPSGWSPLGNPTEHLLGPAAWFQGRLYASAFNSSTGAYRLLAWDGSTWSSVSRSVGQPFIGDLLVFDDGTGPQLYVAGGVIVLDGQQQISGIARFDGTSWSTVGGGLAFTGGSPFGRDLEVFDDGSGPALYLAGSFSSAGGIPARRIARWNGVTWSDLGAALAGDPLKLLAFDADGNGPAAPVLCGLGGSTGLAGTDPPSNAVVWNGVQWTELPSVLDMGNISVAAVHDPDGPAGPIAPSIVVAGTGSYTQGPAQYIRRWNGTAWVAMGEGLSEGGAGPIVVRSMAAFDPDGPGATPSLLYVSGRFDRAGSTRVSAIAAWDGSAWRAVQTTNTDPRGLSTFDPDGPGPLPEHLLLVGTFSAVDLTPAQALARFNGSTWSAVPGFSLSTANILKPFDPDGAGPSPEQLAVAGEVPPVGNQSFKAVFIVSGSSVQALGAALEGDITDLEWFDDGSGPALYASRQRFNPPAPSTGSVARWSGTAWVDVSAGLPPDTTAVGLLEVFDDDGPRPRPARLYAIAYATAGATLIRWDGSSWTALPGSINGSVVTSRVWSDRGVSSLYLAGNFSKAGAQPSIRIARWGLCPGIASCAADWNYSGTLTASDIFAFLTSYFSPTQLDINDDGVKSPADIFAFLNAYFAGC